MSLRPPVADRYQRRQRHFYRHAQQQANGQCHHPRGQQRYQPRDRFNIIADVHSRKLELARTVTVTGVNDHIADGNQSIRRHHRPGLQHRCHIQCQSGTTVSLTNVNYNTAVINVSPTSGLQTDTNGGTASFNLTLNSRPTANVTIPVAAAIPTRERRPHR